MTFTTDAEIDRIASGVLDRHLPKAEWTHAAHFALALWLLRHRENVPLIMPGIIRAYNEATGVKKYRHQRLSRDDHPGVSPRRQGVRVRVRAGLPVA